MTLEWLGKYRNLFDAVYRAANAYSQACRMELVGVNVPFSAYEIQIMEHIMEHENENMKQHAYSLGLSPSTYTKYVQKLVKKGLVEKYHIAGNNKNIVLRVTDFARQEYKLYSAEAYDTFFKELFEKLDTYSESQIAQMTDFLNMWGEGCYQLLRSDNEKEDAVKLIAVEDKK